MPRYNPYLLQLPQPSPGSWEQVAALIGYAIAVLAPCLARRGCSREEVLGALASPPEAPIPKELREELSRKSVAQDASKLLNDLRRLGIVDVYQVTGAREEYVSPSESGWPGHAVARPGPNAAPAYSVLRRCLSRGGEPRDCLVLAVSAAAARFLYVGGGSSKLREVVRALIEKRLRPEEALERLGSGGEQAALQRLQATLTFFQRSLEFIREVASRRPGLVPPGYLRLLEALSIA